MALVGMSAENKRAYVVLSFSPSVELVSVVRRFVEQFYEKILGDPDVTSRVAVATHELLENAVKYSLDGATDLRVEIADGPASERMLSIQIKNRARQEDIAIVRQMFDDMGREPEPMAYYQRLMRKTAGTKAGSGLGFGRVRAEADMALTCEIDRDWLVIVAKTRLGEACA